jgi:hypothetical protein
MNACSWLMPRQAWCRMKASLYQAQVARRASNVHDSWDSTIAMFLSLGTFGTCMIVLVGKAILCKTIIAACWWRMTCGRERITWRSKRISRAVWPFLLPHCLETDIQWRAVVQGAAGVCPLTFCVLVASICYCGEGLHERMSHLDAPEFSHLINAAQLETWIVCPYSPPPPPTTNRQCHLRWHDAKTVAVAANTGVCLHR